MSSITLSHPTKNVNGIIHLPASKSISNRLLLIKAIAGFSDVEINNLSTAKDTETLQGILTDITEAKVIDVHHAGTVMRFLTAYLCCMKGSWILTGSERMQQRPIRALVNALRTMGADIRYVKEEGYPPLMIHGKKLEGGEVEVDGRISSQFISALLMMSPLLKNPLELSITNDVVSAPYIKMTLNLMQQWGATYTQTDNVITVANNPYTKPSKTVFVESDWSAASYFYSILSLAKEGEITLPKLFKNSLQGDSVCAVLFAQLGVSTTFTNEGVVLKKINKITSTFAYNFINCPDIAQTLAVCCAAKNIAAKLTGLQTLSIKETNRITALKTELAKFDADVIITNNSIEIKPSHTSHLTSHISTYDDHRMAMSFAPLALCNDTIEMENPAVVEKSFPHFWDELNKIGFTTA